MEMIKSERELVEVFFNTNINDPKAVTELIQNVNNNCIVDEKDKYLQILDWITSSNIKISQKYAKFSEDDQNTLKKNIGWIIFGAIVAIATLISGGDFDAIPESVGYLSWIGIGVQIYIITIKTVWKKLTLDGKIIHPMLRANGGVVSNTRAVSQSQPVGDTNNHPENSQGKSSCKFCGNELKPGARFCANCGKEQK